MKQYQLLVLFLFLSYALSGQQSFYVKVINAGSSQSLAFANVWLSSNQKGDATDIYGLAYIDLPKKFIEKDTINCSFIGFRDTAIVIDIHLGDTVVVELVQEAIPLSAVEITSKHNSSTGLELVQAAIKRVKHNYLDQDTRFEAFYRETVYEAKQCVWVGEAAAQMYYTAYPQRGFTKKSWRRYWKDAFKNGGRLAISGSCQNYANFGHAQFFKYYNTIDDQCRVTATRKSQNWSRDCHTPLIKGGPLGISSADKVKYQADFLDPRLLAKYDYYRDGAVMIDDRLCLVVRFKPKFTVKPVSQPWDKKIDFALFSGTLYIHSQNFAIVKVECQFAKSSRTNRYKYAHPWQTYPTHCSIVIDYKPSKANQKWYMHSVKTYQLLKGNRYMKWDHEQDFECVRELWIKPQEGAAESFEDDDPQLLKDINNTRLMDVYLPYDVARWEEIEQNAVYRSMSPKDLKQLNSKKNLELQFQGE